MPEEDSLLDDATLLLDILPLLQNKLMLFESLHVTTQCKPHFWLSDRIRSLSVEMRGSAKKSDKIGS